MKKIVTVLGARPQFIKAGSVSRAINKKPELQEIIVHTGQHYDANMSDVFFSEMSIAKPSYFLDVGGKSHGAMTGQMLEKIETVLARENPDWLLVYGDTNSTLAGALAASKMHIKIAHVQAGLRSFNAKMPEEINRILTDRISHLLFCPTQTAVDNLAYEKATRNEVKIILSGDVMQDGAMFYKPLAKKPVVCIDEDFILCTIHRAENTDSKVRLSNIVKALNEISEDKSILMPIHPRTKQKLDDFAIKVSDRIEVIDPVGYLNMVWLIDNCERVMTDSGGLQKEAFFFSKPCITMRDETEWVELIDNNFNVLVGANTQNIVSAYRQHLFATNFDIDLYGNGRACQRVVDALCDEH